MQLLNIAIVLHDILKVNMYLPRHLEEKVAQLGQRFKSVLVLGARQVGKTTLLKHLFPSARYFVFDPTQDLYGARVDPDLFLKSYAPPLVLDEVQYVPEVLSALKRFMDNKRENGQYFLTGSQNFAALKQISESLAGRVVIIELDPLSIYELTQTPISQSWLHHYITSPETLLFTPTKTLKLNLLEIIWRGTYPGTLDLPLSNYPDFFNSYLQTYVERDVRNITNIRDLADFTRFASLQAALTAQEVNAAFLGREIGISPQTAQNWQYALQNSYQLIIIPAYSGNLLKRLSQKSKAYWSDTGFACYLMRINSPDALLSHPAFGHLYETFCVNQILRILKATGKSFNTYHWRTGNGAEVDLIIEMNGTYYPIEFKSSTNPTRRYTRGITQFRADYSHLKIAPGVIVHGGDQAYKLSEDVYAVPWGMVL